MIWLVTCGSGNWMTVTPAGPGVGPGVGSGTGPGVVPVRSVTVPKCATGAGIWARARRSSGVPLKTSRSTVAGEQFVFEMPGTVAASPLYCQNSHWLQLFGMIGLNWACSIWATVGTLFFIGQEATHRS